MSFRNKLALQALGLIIFVVAVSSTAVSVIVRNQYVDISTESIEQAFIIIQDDLYHMKEMALSTAQQAISSAELASNLKLMDSYQGSDNVTRGVFTFESTLQSLYGTMQANNLFRVSVYDKQGRLVVFLKNQAKGTFVGYVLRYADRVEYRHDTVGKEAAISFDQFEKADEWPLSKSLLKVAERPEKEWAGFVPNDRRIELSACAIPKVEVFDPKAKKRVPKPIGMLKTSRLVGKKFAERISLFSGTDVMVFGAAGKGEGSLDGYGEVDLDGATGRGRARTVGDRPIFMDDVTVNGQTYARGFMPVKQGDRTIGAVASLYSHKIINSNTFQLIKWLGVAGIGCVVLILPVAFLLARTVTRPITTVVSGLKDVAEGEGDLTLRLNLNRKDEIGQLAHWFDVFMGRLGDLIRDIGTNSAEVDKASANLLDLSRSLAKGADEARNKSEGITGEAEEMNQNILSVSAAMEQASTNLSSVAASTDEIVATIDAIVQNTEQAAGITDRAGTQADSASKKVDALGNSIEEINVVTETITEISEQTNLLALNATIEAARAGEAGKGFAVVANEIKDLAGQTSEATGKIKETIQRIQSISGETVDEIGKIPEVIKQIDEIVGKISTAMEEQSHTTKEISANATQVSEAISEVNQKVSLSTEATGRITANIGDLNQSTGNIAEGSGQVEKSTGELSELSRTLKELVEKFKVD
ncbi:MAG: methyl-accepting chemotaxis protein [Desulfarculaceae bacterium]|nr:methyl-accepting chemotaxis protein [Desulfarculaceae bacterium]